MTLSSARQRTTTSPSLPGDTTSGISRVLTPGGVAPSTGISFADHFSVPVESADQQPLLSDRRPGTRSNARPDSSGASSVPDREHPRGHHRIRLTVSRFRATDPATDRVPGRANRFPCHQPAAGVQLGNIAVQSKRRVSSAAHTRNERAVFQGHDDYQRGIQQTV